MPRAYENETASKGKNDRKGAYKGKKMMKKGPTNVKMKEVDPPKNFAQQILKKVPMAYKSLNPTLVMLIASSLKTLLSNCISSSHKIV